MIPASAPTGVQHVVVVAVPGLTSTVARKLEGELGELDRMAAAGASTRNARTAKESTTADANLFSLLTGRRVYPKRGGHGVGSRLMTRWSFPASSRSWRVKSSRQ